MDNLQVLKNCLKDKEWFCDVGLTDSNKPVVYVHHMSLDIFDIIISESKALLLEHPHIHFSTGLSLDKSRYVTDLTKPKISWDDGPEPDFDSEPETFDISLLTEEVSKLRKVCGDNILSDIFYEVHDGKNAITNLSVKFPEVREALNHLYVEYGFDLIYEQVEA